MTIKYYQAPFKSGKVHHGFFTRNGGVSAGVYDSLCFSYKRYYDADIQENIARVEAELGIASGCLKLINQVHSNECLVVDDANMQTNTIGVDAVITTIPGIAVGAMTADCCPILVWDENAGIVAAIHAGWRGASLGVVENTIAKVISMGANPSSMKAAIGPTISQASYEVDLPVFEAFSNAEDYFTPVQNRQDKWQFNLPGYCEGVLNKLGVGQVHNLNLDTYTNEAEFFSCRRATHRKESGFGGHLSVVKLVV